MKERRAAGRFSLRSMVLLLLLIPGLYVAHQLVTVFTPSYTYETAVLSTMSDSMMMDGFVLFEETVVEDDRLAEYGFLVGDGEKVSAGTAIAELYTDPAQSGIRARLLTIQSQIDLLEKSQNVSVSNVNTLLTQRSTALYDMLDGIDRKALKQLQGDKDQYLTAQNKLQITTGEATSFDERIRELKEEYEALKKQLGTPHQITAPGSGYFTSAQNASFLQEHKEYYLELAPAELEKLLRKEQTEVPRRAVGKIVSSYTWYFYGSCTLEQAERFNDVKSVSITFPGRADDVLPATVVSVVKDKGAELAAVTLKCEYIGPEILHLGQESAQIIFETFTGLRISSDAIRMIKEEVKSPASSGAEGENEEVLSGEQFVKGVYVKYGNVAKFRRIVKLYEGDGYTLVPINSKVGSENEVRMYDEVIVEGTDLYDGKLL